MKRFAYIILLVLTLDYSAFANNPVRPNVLILFLDDLDPDFGCYGNSLVTTPNIDRLASEGLKFTNAFATATVCSPSHTSLFSGCYSTTIGCPHHRSHYIEKLPEGYFSLTELMKDEGYFTVNFKSNGNRMYNKIYGASAKTDLNFDRGKPENNLESGKEVFEHLQIIDPTNISTYFKGGIWKKKKDRQPFFAYANIETGKKHGFEPGRIWAQENGIAIDSSNIDIPPFYYDNQEVRHTLTAALDAVSHTDFEVGKFLNALEQAGLKENTLVILLSDHGATLMRHKQCLWYTGLHIPMIMRWPNHIKPKTINCDLASIIDIAPTILSACQSDTPNTMEGMDLLSNKPQKRKYIFATKDGLNGYFDCSRAVISKDFYYIHHFFPEIPHRGNPYAQGTLTFKSMLSLYKNNQLNELQSKYFYPNKDSIELYLMSDKNLQVYNLAMDKKYSKELMKMQSILYQWQKNSNDEVLNAHEILQTKYIPKGTLIDDLLKPQSNN